jgi:hypothetical protein
MAGLDTPNTGLDPGLDPGISTIQGKGLQDLQDLTPNILENCQIPDGVTSKLKGILDNGLS